MTAQASVQSLPASIPSVRRWHRGKSHTDDSFPSEATPTAPRETERVRFCHRRVRTHACTFSHVQELISLNASINEPLESFGNATCCQAYGTAGSANSSLKSNATATLSTHCDYERPSDSFDDIIADSLGNTASSSCSQHSFVATVGEIEREEANMTSLRDAIQCQEQELARIMESLERNREELTASEKRSGVLKAQLALEQGGGPVYWGISVRQLEEFADGIKSSLRNYCVEHRCERGTWNHVCLRADCQHDHGSAKYRALHAGEDPTELEVLEPNMHTVVEVFIKPMTENNHGVRGLALTLNDEQPKKVEKFVSHSWSGRFEHFVATLSRNLLPETVVFVCSFALPQNLDVGPILDANLGRTPFAQAHKLASEVWLVIDHSIDVIDRLWVIYELYLSLRRKKPIMIGLTKMDSDFRKSITSKVRSMDVRNAKASKDTDLRAIKNAIDGMEDVINKELIVKLTEKVHQLDSLDGIRRELSV